MSQVTNIEQYLSSKYDFRYNEITNKLDYKLKSSVQFQELKEYDLNTMLREINNGRSKKIQKKDLAELLNSNFTPVYNPFKHYFENLPDWKESDGDYIDALANTVTVPESEKENWKNWLKKWIIGVVACALEDNSINQTVLVFVGDQGIGKTSWMSKLCPASLKTYYYGGSINPGNKDTEIQLSENLLINLDELENLGRKNSSALKEIITKPSIKIRRPYGAYAENMPRRASFMGSVNDREFLKDKTGSRRFLCFETIDINNNQIIEMDKVFSQAFHLYKNGYRYWFNREEEKAVNIQNENYQAFTFEQELLMKHFEPIVGNQEPDFMLETEELVNKLCQKSTLARRLSPKILGSALNQINWPKKKTGGRRKWLLKEKVVSSQN